MSSVYSIPLWYYLLLSALSLYAILQLLLFPLLRRLIYNQSSLTKKSLGNTLNFGLPAYAMAKRQLWVDRLLDDEQIQQAIEIAAEEMDSTKDAEEIARKFAAEMVPSFSTLLYFRVGYWMARRFFRAFYWIHIGQSSSDKYRKIAKNSCVVMVSNHRSNFDPLLMAYLTSKIAPISYSAGEWALTAPFRQILQAMGFYVIRRDQAGNALYQKILERYVFLATSHCVPQGVFIEGGLSRDGYMQSLRMGLINYICKASDTDTCKDIVFIPCALNYDKIPEDKTLVIHKEDGFKDKGRFYTLISFLKFFTTVVTYVVPRRFRPFGYSCVNFGEPISLRDWQKARDIELAQLNKDDRRKNISVLGDELAAKINELIPILPCNLLAQIVANNKDTPLTELELKVKAMNLADQLVEQGVKVFIPDNDGDYAFSQGIYILLRRKLIEPTGDGRFSLVTQQQEILDYYCNTIDDVLNNHRLKTMV